MGKSNDGPFNVTQGGAFNVNAQHKATGPSSLSGATEPVWPQSLGATVVDGSGGWTGGVAGGGSGSGSPLPTEGGGVGVGSGGGGGLINPGMGGGIGSGSGITWTAIYARKTTGIVTGILSPQIFQHNKGIYPAHYFQYGFVVWKTGANAGRRIEVRDSMGPQPQANGVIFRPYIFMLELAPNPIAVGDTFEATVGCNKMRLKCQYFINFANFRGFPDMPTEERALQTPNIMNGGYAPKQTK